MSRLDETCTPTSIAEISTSEYIQIAIDESEFRIFSSGIIHRLMKSGNWKEITNKINHKQGYNVIMIKKKTIHERTNCSTCLLKYGFI